MENSRSNASYLGVLITYVSPITYANTILIWMFFGILFLINMPLNTFLIVVIQVSAALKKKPINLITQSFLVSDILSAIVSVGYCYMLTNGYDVYELPDIICRITYIGDHVTSYVTSLHILLLTVYRYYCVIHWKNLTTFTMARIKNAIWGIWVVSIVCGGVGFIAVQVKHMDRAQLSFGPSCGGAPGKGQVLTKMYIAVMYPTFFFIPFIAICVLTGIVVNEIYSKKAKRKLGEILQGDRLNERWKRHARIVRGLLFINGTYAFGLLLLPLNIGIAIISKHRDDILAVKTFHFLMVLGYGCLRISEAINPFVHMYTNSALKEAVVQKLKKNCLIQKNRVQPDIQFVNR